MRDYSKSTLPSTASTTKINESCVPSLVIYILIDIKNTGSQAWWYMPVILALQRLEQEDLKFKARVSYIVRPCL
jgi:hypothetical protein